MYDFLIVGAGLAGAVLAHELKKKGYKVIVVEKRENIGGNCMTSDFNGITIHEYGPSFLSEEAFREAESTDFITSFVLGKVKNHTFRTITDDDVLAYYRENADLFTRAGGDPFAPEEVRDIIIKRLREREYRENVEAISLQHRDSQ